MLLGAIEQLWLRAVGLCRAVRCGLRMQSYAEPMWRHLLRGENVEANHTKCEHNVWPYVTHAVAEWGKGALGAKTTNSSRPVHETCSVGKRHLWLYSEHVPMQKQGKQSALRCVQTGVCRQSRCMLAFQCSQQPKLLCR